MKTETEESLRSSVNHETEKEESLRSSVNLENGDGRRSSSEPWKRRRKKPYVLVWTIKMETEESLSSSVNHENGNGGILRF